MCYESMPLYPGMKPPCDASPFMKVKLFDDGCCGPHRAPPMRQCERVVIDNPCFPGERAEVTLGVDDCGNLVICVHRLCGCGHPRPERPDCGCMPPPRRPECRPQCHRRPPWPWDGCGCRAL